MKPLNVARLYCARLRARWMQELLATVGIGAGVALLFASQVASSSLQSSVSQLAHGIAGDATLQLLARGDEGMPEGLLARVRAIDGVRVAAPVLEAGANAIGPKGAESLQLIGADSSLSRLGGALVRQTALRPFAGIGAVALPATVASKIGVSSFGREVHFQLAGRSGELPLYSVLRSAQVGPLAASAIAIVPLSSAQEMTGLGGRLSRILVASAAGSERRVRAALARVAAGRLNVETIDYEERLFAQAAGAASQSSELFSAVSALVGFLFAFNAVLLTMPQRRRLVIDLRREGYTPRTAIGVLVLDALALGLAGCLLGLALGEELSIHVLHANPAFLSIAFAVGSQRVVDWQSVAIATGAGMLAALVAVLSPLRDVLARTAVAEGAPPAHARSRPLAWLALAGVGAGGAATAILLAAPDAAIPGMVLLTGALLLVLPLVLGAALGLVARLARGVVGAVPHLAVMELGAAGARAVAITATGAIAIFGAVAIGGAHDDLLKGLDRSTHDINALADIWVAPAGSYDLMSTAPFRPVDTGRLARLPGVASVRSYRGGLLDYGDRRVLVIAPPPQSQPLLPAGQIVQGQAGLAAARVRAGGWLVLSQAIASERHLHVGQALTLPTPQPISMRIAALSTNVGWVPGAIIMNASDYARAWGSQDASAYDVQLVRGASSTRVVGEIRHALGAGSGLAAHSAQERAAAQQALSSQALARLTQIAALIPIVAVLAMAAAISAMVWQRRPRLAKLKLDGLARVELWRTILFESALLVGVGCLTGAAFGLYAQQLADRALVHTINFPIEHSVTALSATSSIALMVVTSLAVLTIPGYLAASVPATLALAD
jgi:putative ABC transport system permease protein